MTNWIQYDIWSENYVSLQNVESLFPDGGGGLPYESDGDAHPKIRIKTLKETNLGVVQALFDP